MANAPFIFPKWFNGIRNAVAVIGAVLPLYVVLVVAYGADPVTTDVGYMPTQPVEFSHALHAGELGMDCRYCHNTVEEAAHAAIPPTQTCMNCHHQIQNDSPKMVKVIESYRTGEPIEWVRIHDLPGYSYFNHAAHVNRGVGCRTCHGRIDRMEVVYQAEPLSMGWCLDCHREPEKYLRPNDRITDMDYELTPEDQLAKGLQLKEEYDIRSAQYLQSCSVCHH
jgi:menaquinone reductase, multiheme cytochrome c subunit